MIPRGLLLKSATALVALSLSGPTVAWADEPTRVVATFSILGDMVKRIGGEHVDVTTLVGRNGDTHVYQPTPQAARAVSEADVMIVNGLEFEGWLERLSEAAGFDGTLVVATTGVDAIAYDEDDDHHDHDDHAEARHDHDHGHDEDHAEAEHDHDHGHDKDHAEAGHDHDHGHDEDHAEAGHDHDHGHDDEHASHDHGEFDPHAWQSLENAVIYVDNITAALARVTPDHAAAFHENRAAYVAEIEALGAEIEALMDALPEDSRTVVTSHDAFAYLGRDHGLTFLAPQGLSTESEASAKDVSELIEQMREENISAVFVENITDSRLLEQIASETGASIGGTLYPDALSAEDGPAATYLDMMRHNARTLAKALGS